MATERKQELLEENARLRQEIALLRQKVDLLVKKIFGASSEKLDPRQLELLLDGSSQGKPADPELAAEATRRSREKSTPCKHRPQGPRLPDHLPCVEEIVDPLPVQAEPEAWRYIGEEVSEQLDYEPARFLKRRMIRRKYVKRGELDAVPVAGAVDRTGSLLAGLDLPGDQRERGWKRPVAKSSTTGVPAAPPSAWKRSSRRIFVV